MLLVMRILFQRVLSWKRVIVFLIFFDAVNGRRVDLQKFLIKNRGSSSCYRPIGISLDYI